MIAYQFDLGRDDKVTRAVRRLCVRAFSDLELLDAAHCESLGLDDGHGNVAFVSEVERIADDAAFNSPDKTVVRLWTQFGMREPDGIVPGGIIASMRHALRRSIIEQSHVFGRYISTGIVSFSIIGAPNSTFWVSHAGGIMMVSYDSVVDGDGQIVFPYGVPYEDCILLRASDLEPGFYEVAWDIESRKSILLKKRLDDD